MLAFGILPDSTRHLASRGCRGNFGNSRNWGGTLFRFSWYNTCWSDTSQFWKGLLSAGTTYMIHAGNLNNSCTDPVTIVMAACTVNPGQTLSPLEPRRDQILACRLELSKICLTLTP